MTPFQRLPFLSLAALSLVTLSGCGVTGGTTARKVKLNPLLAQTVPGKSAQIGDASASPNAGANRAIGAYNLGKFDASDLDTLRESVRRSLPPAADMSSSVHIVVQHFGLAFTNNRVACLAIVDWCVSEGPLVIASERFYAAYDTGDKLFGTETIGMAKNRVLHAAAARITERTLAAVNGLSAPPGPALTFDDPESASTTLPTRMVAAGAPGLVPAVVQQTMLGGFEGAVALLPDPLPSPIDWKTRLIANGANQPASR